MDDSPFIALGGMAACEKGGVRAHTRFELEMATDPMGEMIWTLFKRTGTLDTKVCKGTRCFEDFFKKTCGRCYDTKCSELSGEI